MQLLQVEVQFSGAPMIQHIDLGYKTLRRKNLDHTFAPAFQHESQLPIFRVVNCDAIGEIPGLLTDYTPFLFLVALTQC